VPKWKLKKLYESISQDIWDEELINDVGMILYMRCRDIVRIHEAQTERRVVCPRCERLGTVTMITREKGREVPMRCPACGWTMTWVDYHHTFQRRQLNPGGAISYFKAFMETYSQAREPKSKMLAIDRVIHEFHYSMRELPDQPTRAAGVNLIEGKLGEVIIFLNELSGMDLPEAFRTTYGTWRSKHESIQWEEILAKKHALGQNNKGTSEAQ
jgi:RNase P subunit RPR2